MVVSIEGAPIGPGPPIHLSSDERASRPPPPLGAHTEEVLTEAGFDAEDVARLRRNGVI
jgi:crotonobetainyl-CoA:carnitine CoA-transferase CaiB-like acyl-CoA transferase